MKSLVTKTILGAALLAGSASATVTLTISNPAIGVLTNISDTALSNANGLLWGVVVDASGNGFSASYGAGLSLANNLNGSLMPGSTDDVFYFNSNITATTPGGQGGTGSITAISGLVIGNLGVNAGDAFALIWFDRSATAGSTLANGSKYGIVTDPLLVIPADGANQPYASAFVGADPIRPTNQTFGTAVPEPSAALLGAIGALGLLRRRRN